MRKDEFILKQWQVINLYNIYRMKRIESLQFLIVLVLCALAFGQQPDPVQTQLQINKLLNVSHIQSGYTFYKVDFELKKDQAKLFLLTVETQESESIEIFTSIYYEGVDTYYKYPNYKNNTNACSYSTIDTCAVALPEVKEGETKKITVFIGVELFFTDQMTILATLEEIYPFKIGVNYDIDFSVWESAVFTLEAEDVNDYQQLIVQMQYDTYKDVGRFAMYAGINEIPNNYANRIESKYMGAFTQILILEPLEDNSTYYIVLEGELGTQFDVTIKPFSTSSPKLEMNQTVFYYSAGSGQKDRDELNFSMAINYAEQEQVLPLLVDLNSLGGYGEFRIDYCEGLTNFTFQNINGESGEVVIPIEERKECYETISNAKALMIENLIVSIRNVPWYFSFSVGVFEGSFPLMMSPYSEKMGTLVASQDSRVYQMEGYINESFILKFKTITGQKQLNFTLYECRTGLLGVESCKKILNSNQNATVDPITPEYKEFNYTCAQRKTYKLQVSHGSLEKFDSEYVLLLLPLNPKPANLSPSKPVYSIISKNQYQYFIVNLTLIQKQSNITINNNTNVLITMIEKNGDCMLLTSLSEKNPKFDQVFESNSTVDYNWNGKKQYSVNQSTQAIYIGVLGSKQSIYHLQVSIKANENAPESYSKLVSDKILSFNLTPEEDHVLLMYTAHSIPYTVIVAPAPSCIVYSFSLPFTNTSCRQLPSEITEKTMYLKIFRKLTNQTSTDDEDFKFVVYVYSGSHYLFEYTPIMIACLDSCYEYVTVYVPQKIKIVHKGMGYIGRKDSTQAYSNEKMDITCQKTYPCFLSINASLPYGGNMQLFYDSVDVQEIEWINKPLTFNSAFESKMFYMQIKSWNSLNTAIFYTEGISVTVYYNIYSMRENATNALEYNFPNSYSYMKKSAGNPLRRFHIVEFDEKMIEELGCKDENDLCIATLAVYANTLGDYSTEYINKSIGYYSCNTYRYYIPMNSPYQLSEEYSLIYFSHEFSEDEKANMAPFYYVRVQPLSSCRPQIFAPFSQNVDNASFAKDMPFYGLYKIDSKTLNKESPQIQFSISTDTPCEYTLWVLDSEIQPVIQNANYEFWSDSNGTITFVYSDKYLWNDKKFSVIFDQQMNQIIIEKYERYPNGSIKVPSISSALAYITQAKHLEYTSTDFLSTLYIVKASTNANNKVNMKISTFEGETVIMTNSIEKFSFNEKNNSVTYRYFSNNDFLMFVTTDSGTVRVTVTDFKRDSDRNVIDVNINQNSDPWIKVNALKNDIRQYIITLENVLLKNDGKQRNLQESSDVKYPRVSLHVEETGTLGLPQLFDGVALFDAFYTDDAQNCYKYISEPIVGRPSLTIDLIFGSQLINQIPNIETKILVAEGKRANSTYTKLPTGYRLQTEYYSNIIYEVCFSITEQPTLASKQFYVMVQNLEYSLKHITLDVPLSQAYPGSYEIYQYVATEDQKVMIEVVNCFGKPTLLGTKHYQDIYTGQVSQLGPFYREETMSVAEKDIPMGYFYFAIKLDDQNSRYKIRVQLLQQNEKLHYGKFQLKQKTITRAKSIEQNGRQKVRVNLPPISMGNLPKQVKVHHITYNLLVDNLKQQQQYSSNVIAKCPVLSNRNLSTYKFVQQFGNKSVKVDTGSTQDIRIDIPTAEVPENFNLTGYVQVSITEPYTQTLTYYYDSTTFKLKNTHEPTGGAGAFTVIFVILLLLGSLIVIFILYRRWKTNQKNTKVAFEMANYNYQTNEQPNHVTIETEKAANQDSPQKSLKKALNENVGYGQFVDESM